ARQFAGQGRERRVVGDIARGEDQRRLAAVQIGELAPEQQMDVAVARNVAGAAGAGADRTHGLFHRREDRGGLTHAEISVRAPNRDLGADAVVEGTWKAATATLEIGKGAIPALGVQRTETLSEEGLVIHGGPPLGAVTLAEGRL